MLARKHYFHYFIVDDDKIDTSYVVKKCNVGETVYNRAEYPDVSLSATKAMRVPIETITIDPAPNAYPGYNKRYNYCYLGDHSVAQKAQYVVQGVAIAIDVGVALIPVVGWVAEAGVAAITGFTAAFINKLIQRSIQWPKYQNIKKDIGKHNMEVSEDPSEVDYFVG